jgi:hypothetical protein
MRQYEPKNLWEIWNFRFRDVLLQERTYRQLARRKNFPLIPFLSGPIFHFGFSGVWSNPILIYRCNSIKATELFYSSII